MFGKGDRYDDGVICVSELTPNVCIYVIDGTGVEELSPAASAASQLVRRGLSLTQLYAEYVTVSEKLMATEEENKRLKRYVDQILQVNLEIIRE